MLQLTKDSAAELMRQLSEVFDVVRLVDPSRTAEYFLQEDGSLELTSYSCYAVWGKGARCENCISAKVFATQDRVTKFEFVGDDVFLAMSTFAMIDGQPFALETVAALNDKTLFAAYERTQFINAINKFNGKLYRDGLTNAYNRSYFEEQVKGLLIDKKHACAIADMDYFKSVNDTYGHQAGDAVLKRFVQVASSVMRKTDIIARIGGDEFFLAFENIPRPQLKKRLEDIQKKMLEQTFDEYPGLKASVTIGAIVPEPDDEDLFLAADEQLYEAKKNRGSLCLR